MRRAPDDQFAPEFAVEWRQGLSECRGMQLPHDDPILTYELDDMNLDVVSRFVLRSYWGKSLNTGQILKSFRNSACVGLLVTGQQIGFGRAISDGATSAYLKDITIFDAFQRKGRKMRSFEVPGQRCNPTNEPKGDRPMAKLKKTDVFTTAQPRSETPFERTIRASKEITDAEAKEREEKTERLRKARHDSDTL